MMTTKLKAHPFAATYPPMDPEEFDALVEDIKKRGLQREIVLYQGQILDGRNRYEACLKAEIEPRFVTYEGDDPLGHVNSLNQYRQMTKGQRAIVAAQQLPLLDGRGGKRSPNRASFDGQARDYLAKRFQVGKNMIQDARWLLEHERELADRVMDCTSTFADAMKEAKDREKLEEERRRDAATADGYKQAIKEGEMTLEEVIDEIQRRERAEHETQEAQKRAIKIWIGEVNRILADIEKWIGSRDDESLAAYTDPDTPGSFDHGITPEKVGKAIEALKRAQSISFGRKGHGKRPIGRGAS
jgi:hypothetical protein